MINNIFSKMIGSVAPDTFRVGMNGQLAVRTASGYKTFNIKKNRLTNCSSFAFDMGMDIFFLMPTQKLRKGDIIIVGEGRPVCVLSVEGDIAEVMNYENSTIERLMVERHIFMGRRFYGKVISFMGSAFSKDGGSKKLMNLMLMSQFMSGGLTIGSDSKNPAGATANPILGMFGGNSQNPMQGLMLMSMLGGGDGLFDLDLGEMFNCDGVLDDEDEDGGESSDAAEEETPAPAPTPKPRKR